MFEDEKEDETREEEEVEVEVEINRFPILKNEGCFDGRYKYESGKS